jgi:hypothetical protein
MSVALRDTIKPPRAASSRFLQTAKITHPGTLKFIWESGQVAVIRSSEGDFGLVAFAPNGGVYRQFLHASGLRPATGEWEPIGGTIASPLSVLLSSNGQHIDLFAPGTEGSIQHTSWQVGVRRRPSRHGRTLVVASRGRS